MKVSLHTTKCVFTCIVVALLASCASIDIPRISSQELAYERELQLANTFATGIEQTDRLYDLLWPLLEKNTAFCRGQTARSLGFRYASPRSETGLNSLERKVRESVLEFNDRAVIYAVAESSPAHVAGLKRHDRIVGIGNWSWTANTASDFNRSIKRRLDALVRSESVSIEIEREGERLRFTLTPTRVCNIALNLKPSLEVQARTNGREIIVTQGMAALLDDEQMRTVLAHELAHCTLRHMTRANLNSGLGLIFDVAFLTQRVWLGGVFSGLSRDAMSIGVEREADYVSMYLLANAGLDTSNRAEIWRVLADEVTFRSSIFTTHPYSPERYLLLTKTHTEIEAKRNSGEPLVPNGMRVPRR